MSAITKNINPRQDQKEWIDIWKARPRKNGRYSVLIIQLNSIFAYWKDGRFLFENGDVIPDSLILGWK